MKRHNLFLTGLTLFAFLAIGFAQPALAQHKAPKQGTKRMQMMQQEQSAPKMMGMQKQGQGKMMGMGKMSMGHMQMMGDPVIKSLHTYGCPGFLLKNADELNLTDKQKQTLNALKLEFKKAAVKNQAEIKVATLDIQEAMNTNNPDFGKVKAEIKKINALQAELRSAFLNTLIKARKTLSAEQLSKLNALPKGMQGMGMQGHGMMNMMK